MLEKPIKLPIYFHSDETARLAELEIESNYEDCEIKQMHFYQISAIVDADFDGNEGSLIYANGDVFECPLVIDGVLKVIEKHLNDIKFIEQ